MKKRELERRRRAYSIALVESGVAGFVLGLWMLLAGGEVRSGPRTFTGVMLLLAVLHLAGHPWRKKALQKRRTDSQGSYLGHTVVVAVGTGAIAFFGGADMTALGPALLYLGVAGWTIWLALRAGHFNPKPFGPMLPLGRRPAARRAGWIIWLAPVLIVPATQIRPPEIEFQYLAIMAGPGFIFLWYGGLLVRLGRVVPLVGACLLPGSVFIWCFIVWMAHGFPYDEAKPILVLCMIASVAAGWWIYRLLSGPRVAPSAS